MLPLLPNLCVAFQPNGQWTLANGTSASFVFLDPAYKAAWRPDGSAANLDTLIRNLGPSYVDAIEQATSPILIVWTRAPAIEPMPPTVRFKFPSTSQIGASFVTLARDKKSYISGGPFLDRQPTQQDVAIGIADGGWTAAGSLTFEPHLQSFLQVRSYKPNWRYRDVHPTHRPIVRPRHSVRDQGWARRGDPEPRCESAPFFQG